MGSSFYLNIFGRNIFSILAEFLNLVLSFPIYLLITIFFLHFILYDELKELSDRLNIVFSSVLRIYNILFFFFFFTNLVCHLQ